MDRLIHRLANLTDLQRSRLAWSLMVLGLGALAVGIFFAHAGLAPDGTAPGEERFTTYLTWVPRHWLVFTGGQLIAIGGSQFILAGAALQWIANKPMTWARAGFATWLAWIELVLVWGVIPSEWLNLTQGPLGFTSQKVAVTIPKWLVLNNPVSLSYAAVKDMILGGYHVFSLVAVLYFALKIQNWGKTTPKVAEGDVVSPYGRPLKKVDA